jgi:hypothetical protein
VLAAFGSPYPPTDWRRIGNQIDGAAFEAIQTSDLIEFSTVT